MDISRRVWPACRFQRIANVILFLGRRQVGFCSDIMHDDKTNVVYARVFGRSIERTRFRYIIPDPCESIPIFILRLRSLAVVFHKRGTRARQPARRPHLEVESRVRNAGLCWHAIKTVSGTRVKWTYRVLLIIRFNDINGENCYSIIHVEMDISAIINRHDIINSSVRIYLSAIGYQGLPLLFPLPLFPSICLFALYREPSIGEHATISNLSVIYDVCMRYELFWNGRKSNFQHFIEISTSHVDLFPYVT